MPRTSIITINFNDEIGLKKTIESTVNQTSIDFEFIIIDGGSTDRSKEIIQKYSKDITHWISEPDFGVYNAMNKGIKLAKGEYLIFMNSGDTFYNEKVLEKAEPFINGSKSIVYGNSAFVKNGVFNRNSIPPHKLSFVHFFNSGLNHQATFIKRELFEKYFYYNETYKIASDWEFFMYTICLKQESYQYIDQFICNYDLAGISSDYSKNSLYAKERDAILRKHFPFLINDFSGLEALGDKRIKNILHIKKHKLSWKILKTLSKIILLFLPKQRN